MKNYVIANTICFVLCAACTSFGLEHSPSWEAGDTICRYGLPGEGNGSQYVDEIQPGAQEWALCRFGNFIMTTEHTPRQTFYFNDLTVGGFTTSGMDTPHAGGIYIWSAVDYFSDRRFTFTELNAGSWTSPASANDGSVEVDGNGSSYMSLFRYFKMTDDQLPSINSTKKRYVILIHGWNPNSNHDAYAGPEFSHLFTSISDWITGHGGDTSWGVLKYHMEADTDTGSIFDGDGGFFADAGTRAAEIARLHGYHLAKLIMEKCPNVEYVHLIAHSAGSWAARSCLQYLLGEHPKVNCQMTLLDAYIPAENNLIQPNSNLSVARMNAITGFNNFGPTRVFGLDNYFAEMTPSEPAFGTQERFDWGSRELVPDVNVSLYWQSQWYGHAGPIEYYADTVDGTTGGWVIEGGWKASMAYEDLEGGGLPDNTGIKSVTIQASPSDQALGFTVDGTNYSSRQTFEWPDGTGHTLSVASYQRGDDDGYYGFKQWSDGITTTTRSVQPSGNVTYTAIFTNSGAVVTTKTPNADTYVLQDSPNSNGQQDESVIWLRESPSSSDSLWGLVKFNLSSIPSGSVVSYAELRLKKYLGPAGPVQIKEVGDAWSESATWNTKPTSGSAFVAEASDTGDGYIIFRSSDYSGVKTMVQGFVNNSSGNNGFYLRSGMPSTDTIAIRSREHTTSSERPTLIVHYTPPPDTTGDSIVNLIAKKSSTGSTITANNWQRDNDPYFSWATTNTVYPIVGYSFALDASTPDNNVDVTVPYYQFSSDSISDGLHTFYVKSLDANGNWGPVASFVIKVDASPPTSGMISINDGAASTWSPMVTLNNLGASAAPSGLDQMKFSNDGSSWTAYENVASTKAGWDLFSNGGGTNVGTKTVYVRYKDNAGNESAIFSDTITYSPVPAITVQPAGDTRSFIGGSATLSVVAQGAPRLTYQWRINGVSIVDATNASSVLTNLQLNQAGLHSVSVSNAFGGTISAGGWLEVSPVAAWGNNSEGQLNVPRGLSSVVAIEGGRFHSLALQADGSVVAWGGNNSGQLNVPEGLSNVVAIAAGWYHSLVLLSNGTVLAWGDSDGGQTDVPMGLSNVVAIAAGAAHNIALKSDGTVVVWGSIAYSEGYEPYPTPDELTHVVSITSGWNHSLALRSDGTVFAWGNNERNQTEVPEDLGTIVAIAAGRSHSLAVKSDGTLVMWGYPDDQPDSLNEILSIAAAGRDTLALRSDSSIVAWGPNSYGQADVPSELNGAAVIAGGDYHSLALIGTGPPTVRHFAVPAYVASAGSAYLKAEVLGIRPLNYQWQLNGQNLASATNATLLLTNIQFSQSGFYSVIVSNALGVATSATNELTVVPMLIVQQPASQVGYLGNDLNLLVMVQGAEPLNYQWHFNGVGIPAATNQMLVLTNVTFSDAGDYSVVVTNLFGGTTSQVASIPVSSVVPWGYYDPSNGLQLMTTPTGLPNVVAVAAGQNHGLVLQSNGMVTAWGGFRDLDDSEEILPMTVPDGLSNVVAIAAGSYHSLALRDNGTVTAWGGYWNGSTNVPLGLSNVVAIAAGENHSLALRADGTVVAWGDNGGGQLDVPLGLSNVVAIAGGEYHSLALKVDGTVVGWGDNGGGDLDVPEGLSDVVAIASGRNHNFALKSDGTTVFWGGFESGDPYPPDDLTDIIAIASGTDHCLALHNDGTVSAWGGFYDIWTDIYFPIVMPEGLRNIRNLAGGETFSLALLGDGGPVMAQQPISRTMHAGQQIVLNAMAGSAEPLSYQWQFTGTNINGGTVAILIIDPARIENTGFYSVIVSNSHGVVVGGPWLVTVARPANDNFADRETIASDFGVTSGNNLDATKEAAEDNHAGVAGGSSVWWTWIPSRAGTATITTDGSSFDTVLAVYTGGSVGALALVASNDDHNPSLQSKLVFPVLRGVPYHIALDGKLGSSGNIVMRRSFEGPHLTKAEISGNTAQFILNGPPGNPYQLQTSSNLVDWVAISTITIPESGSILLSDQIGGDHPQRFYRVTFDFSHGLVAHYPLEGNAIDASGNGWNGNPIGPIPTTGVIGQAYYFDGQNDRISLPGSFLNSGLAQGTLACWLMVESSNAGQTIFNRGVATRSTALAFGIEGSPGKLRGHLNSNSLSLGNATLPLNQFFYAVLTWDGIAVRYYIDGQLDLEIPIGDGVPTGSSQTVDIGVDDQNSGWFHGVIDEVRIYNRALNPSAVHQLYFKR